MRKKLTFGHAVSIGVALALVITVAAIAAAFVLQLSVDVPGVLQIAPGGNGAPSTAFVFNPLATMVLALVIALAIWLPVRLTRARSHRASPTPR
jgi:hypothetical protein